jgi:predicted methyltransferase
MLRNPDDDHSITGFDEGRHTMDRYLLKFRKVAK